MPTKLLLPLFVLCSLWSTLPAAAQKGAAKAPEGGTRHIYKTIGEVKLPLYVYTPESRQPGRADPAIVFFFGGGWRAGSPTQFEPHCKHLANRGMVAVTVEYRVSSRHDVMIEDCISDARSAMRWVRAHARELGIDPNRIASGGGSAGGHLAAAVAVIEAFDDENDDQTISPRPNAMVLFNPAMAIAPHKDLPEAYNARFKDRLNKRSRGPIAKVSPFTYAAKKQPPGLMFFGSDDELRVGADAYCKASVAAGNECRIVTYDGQGHGFFNFGRSNNTYYDLTVAEMDKFLVKLGWLKDRER